MTENFSVMHKKEILFWKKQQEFRQSTKWGVDFSEKL